MSRFITATRKVTEYTIEGVNTEQRIVESRKFTSTKKYRLDETILKDFRTADFHPTQVVSALTQVKRFQMPEDAFFAAAAELTEREGN